MKQGLIAAVLGLSNAWFLTNNPWMTPRPYNVTVVDKMVIPGHIAELSVVYVDDVGKRGDFSASPATYTEAKPGMQYTMYRSNGMTTYQRWICAFSIITMVVSALWAIWVMLPDF